MNPYRYLQTELYEICQPTVNSKQVLIDQLFGQMTITTDAVGHDLDLLRFQAKVDEPVQFYAKEQDINPIITLSFFLRGKVDFNMKSEREILTGHQGMAGILYSPDHQGYMQWSKQNQFDLLSVRISRERFIQCVSHDMRPEVMQLFGPLISNTPEPFRLFCSITSEISRLLHDLANPSGMIGGDLLRDARAHELFFSVLEEMISQYAGQSDKRILSRSDEKRLLQAKELLLLDLVNPPGLKELAREVGLNDFKLKKGFKECFNTTAYSLLHEERMQQAKRLIYKGKHTITEVSGLVGYTCHGHFSAAFRKRFGMTPRQFSQQYVS